MAGMRHLLAAGLLLFCTAAHASPTRDDRYFVAWQGTSARDVTRALAQIVPYKRPVVRKSHHARAHAARKSGRRIHKPRRKPGPAIPGVVGPLAHATVVGGRPAGCPWRFCGCGASLHLFGRIIPALNLAANWLRFPRAAPAPKMAAARRGHVFVLERHIRGNIWLAYDANSGGHRTRIHPRSIAGYTIVNPHGSRYARSSRGSA